jgi:hypothetical protein
MAGLFYVLRASKSTRSKRASAKKPRNLPPQPRKPQELETLSSASTPSRQHCKLSLHIRAIEAAMLQELQRTHNQFRNLERLMLGLIREEYGKKGGS